MEANVIADTHPGGSGSDTISLSSPERFLNRELSWLDFASRLVDLAEDEGTSLLERVKFIAIWSSGLDEFFQVRVAGLKDQIAAGLAKRSHDGMTATEQLDAIGERCRAQIARVDDIFLNKVPCSRPRRRRDPLVGGPRRVRAGRGPESVRA